MESVLLLNATYEPLQIITWRRAVRLLTLGRVEVIEESTREVRSFSLAIRMPAVVRLLRMVHPRWQLVKFSRVNVYLRDNFSCQFCGKRKDVQDLTLDHVLPRTLGGVTRWENVVACCVPCNSRKGGRTPDMAGMRLLSTPRKPAHLPGVSVEIYRRMKQRVAGSSN